MIMCQKKVLDMIEKIIGIGKCDDNRILINMEDKLPYTITLKNIVMLMTCVIKGDGDFFSRTILRRSIIRSINDWLKLSIAYIQT